MCNVLRRWRRRSCRNQIGASTTDCDWGLSRGVTEWARIGCLDLEAYCLWIGCAHQVERSLRFSSCFSQLCCSWPCSPVSLNNLCSLWSAVSLCCCRQLEGISIGSCFSNSLCNWWNECRVVWVCDIVYVTTNLEKERSKVSNTSSSRCDLCIESIDLVEWSITWLNKVVTWDENWLSNSRWSCQLGAWSWCFNCTHWASNILWRSVWRKNQPHSTISVCNQLSRCWTTRLDQCIGAATGNSDSRLGREKCKASRKCCFDFELDRWHNTCAWNVKGWIRLWARTKQVRVSTPGTSVGLNHFGGGYATVWLAWRWMMEVENAWAGVTNALGDWSDERAARCVGNISIVATNVENVWSKELRRATSSVNLGIEGVSLMERCVCWLDNVTSTNKCRLFDSSCCGYFCSWPR
jgi:hypothetical protein